MKKLDGKVAIVTGSGQGIGKAYAKVFAREGALVTVTDIAHDHGEATVKEIIDEGGKALFVPGDVRNRDDVKNVVNQTVTAFGKINILVNNAQIEGPEGVFVESIEDEVFESIWRSGLMGTLYYMQECFPYLKEAKGNIINTGSGAATMGLPTKGAYAANKEAIRGLSLVAAREWGQYGITINTIMPAVETEMYKRWAAAHPDEAASTVAASALRRNGDGEEDLAPIVVFLASDDSKYFTGQTLHADGGKNFVR